MKITDEPTNKPCINCDYNPNRDKYKTLRTQDGRGICISCATENNEILSNNREIINQHIKYDIEETEFEEVEDGWYTEGTFGVYSVRFNTRDAEVRKRISVDDEKVLGRYIKLDKKGTVTILEPHSVETNYDVADSTTKQSINEQRAEDSINRRH